jgi:hypothetical protein
MANPIDPDVPGFRSDLDGGTVLSAGAGAESGRVLVDFPADRAHELAHLLGDWATAFAVVLDRGTAPSNYTLGRALDDAAAAAGDPDALACATRKHGSVPVDRRRAAVAILQDREPRLSGVQRLAVVDAAASWLQQQAGDELAFALLTAVCSTDVVTNLAYLALLAPPPAGDPESVR